MESFSKLLAESEISSSQAFKNGTYSSVILDKNSEDTIEKITKQFLGIKNPYNRYGYHITTMYTSRIIELPYIERKLDFYIDSYTIESWKDINGTYTYVMTLKSDDLNRIWESYIDKGSTWDYPQYTPHVTLSYKEKEPINTIFLHGDAFKLHAVKEIVSDLD